jgi:hypothetical protein
MKGERKDTTKRRMTTTAPATAILFFKNLYQKSLFMLKLSATG